VHPVVRTRTIEIATALLLDVAVDGCLVGPDFHPLAAPTVSGYAPKPLPLHTASADVVGGAAQTFEPGQEIPAEWWTLFRSQQLNQLIAEAIAENPSLEVAQAALRAAAENVSAEQGYLYPSVVGSVAGARQRRLYYEKGIPSGVGAPYNLFSAGVDVTYTLDVFGGIRRLVEAYRAVEEYQRDQLEATYLALTANVVTAAVQEASLRDEIAATLELENDEGDQLDTPLAGFLSVYFSINLPSTLNIAPTQAGNTLYPSPSSIVS
jgi:outer membrane protein TolC